MDELLIYLNLLDLWEIFVIYIHHKHIPTFHYFCAGKISRLEYIFDA